MSLICFHTKPLMFTTSGSAPPYHHKYNQILWETLYWNDIGSTVYWLTDMIEGVCLLLWWSSSRVMSLVVMCHRDSDRARFSTITLIESMWKDSS